MTPKQFRGQPCVHGHGCVRYVSTRRCVTCTKNECNRYRANNSDKMRVYNSNYVRERRGLPEPTRPEPAACECCGDNPPRRGLNLDHDHETGDFRGWLCDNCNRGIGMLGDTIAGLRRALVYLRTRV